jgi:hypothetical protein
MVSQCAAQCNTRGLKKGRHSTAPTGINGGEKAALARSAEGDGEP